MAESKPRVSAQPEDHWRDRLCRLRPGLHQECTPGASCFLLR